MDNDTAARLLQGERRRVERVLRDLDAANPETLSDYDRRHNEQLRAQLQTELEAVERAEARLVDGTYGMSIESGVDRERGVDPGWTAPHLPHRRAHRRGAIALRTGER
jgi:hypothetical protein